MNKYVITMIAILIAFIPLALTDKDMLGYDKSVRLLIDLRNQRVEIK